MRLFLALIAGLLFGLGIAISGMINPAKITNFLDIAGQWDPSLAFVMAGGLLVALPGYQLIFAKQKAPLLDTEFHVPTKTRIDAQLLAGAAVFGIGWGLAGFCPGGSIPALSSNQTNVYAFVAAMVLGLSATNLLRKNSKSSLRKPDQAV